MKKEEKKKKYIIIPCLIEIVILCLMLLKYFKKNLVIRYEQKHIILWIILSFITIITALIFYIYYKKFKKSLPEKIATILFWISIVFFANTTIMKLCESDNLYMYTLDDINPEITDIILSQQVYQYPEWFEVSDNFGRTVNLNYFDTSLDINNTGALKVETENFIIYYYKRYKVTARHSTATPLTPSPEFVIRPKNNTTIHITGNTGYHANWVNYSGLITYGDKKYEIPDNYTYTGKLENGHFSLQTKEVTP